MKAKGENDQDRDAVVVWVERVTGPSSAATCRRVERTKTVHRSVNALCVRLSGW
jgi:hypothetical protein